MPYLPNNLIHFNQSTSLISFIKMEDDDFQPNEIIAYGCALDYLKRTNTDTKEYDFLQGKYTRALDELKHEYLSK